MFCNTYYTTWLMQYADMESFNILYNDSRINSILWSKGSRPKNWYFYFACLFFCKNYTFVADFWTDQNIFWEKSYYVYIGNCYQTKLIAKLQVKYLNEKCFNLVLIFGFFSASNVDTLFITYIYQNDFKHAHGKLHKHNQIFLKPRFTPHKPKCRAEI